MVASQEPDKRANGMSGTNERALTFCVWLFLTFAPPQIDIGVESPSVRQMQIDLSSLADAIIVGKIVEWITLKIFRVCPSKVLIGTV